MSSSLDEVKKLAATPCKHEVLKRAALFSCLTGLRISDIQQLSWDHIIKAEDGYVMRLRTEKTEEEANLPITEEALELCGERSEGLVFKELKRSMINYPLKAWIAEAGITRRITFHCFRHTYATLLSHNGVPIYTISKMLTHRSVKNTQKYAEVTDPDKRSAAKTISLK